MRKSQAKDPKGVIALLRLLPRVSKPLTAIIGAAILIGGALPLAFIVTGSRVVGAVPGAIEGGFGSGAGRSLVLWLAASAGIFVAQQVLEPLRLLAAQTLSRRIDVHMRHRAMAAALRPEGIAHLEDPQLQDIIRVARGQQEQFTPGSAVIGLHRVMATMLLSVGSVALVATFRWWLGLVMLVVGLTCRYAIRQRLMRMVDLMTGQVRTMRRAHYYRDMVLTQPVAREARVFGLGAWVGDRFRSEWLTAMRVVWRDRRGVWALAAWTTPAMGAGIGLGAVMLARAATSGEIGLESIALIAGGLLGTMNVLNLDDGDILLAYGLPAFPALDRLERATRDLTGRVGPQADPAGLPRAGIAFEDVSFTYPGGVRVFDGLDLRIEAGRSLAVVGPNGAGKTTLVKLLSGLYTPSSGTIAVDGIPLEDLDVGAWQRRIAAIFQDFIRYELSATENVSLLDPDRAAAETAAERAGALEIVRALPSGWDTVLSRAYEGGTDLSGGQWQRIALARALHAVGRGAGVLVLDEPTANLDVRAEVELFDRFLELTRGLTTILISHRFSTVRRADRIVVLDGGRVTEDGTHAELLALGGRYAEMFNLQAARFAEGTEAVL